MQRRAEEDNQIKQSLACAAHILQKRLSGMPVVIFKRRRRVVIPCVIFAISIEEIGFSTWRKLMNIELSVKEDTAYV